MKLKFDSDMNISTDISATGTSRVNVGPSSLGRDSHALMWTFVLNDVITKEGKACESIEDREVRLLATPMMNDDRASHLSKTPISLIDKMGPLSPEKTTVQKRLMISPQSYSSWGMVTSSLKKTKHLTSTAQDSLFLDSDRKLNFAQKAGDIGIPAMESNFLTGDCVAFPDLERPSYEQIFWGKPILEKTLGPALFPLSEFSYPEEKPRGGLNDMPVIAEVRQESKFVEEGCNCRNTKCLKLYCECLRKGKYCVGCNCTGCENHSESDYRKERIRHIEKKNPFAFKPIIVSDRKNQQQQIHNKGCNCRRSNCLKNYCECHQFGVRCSEFCKCLECKNLKPEESRTDKIESLDAVSNSKKA